MNTRLLILFLCAAASSRGANYYIDYVAGSDAYAGTNRAAPWQHCPGDALAGGVAKAAKPVAGDTILFKGGVAYNGKITVVQGGIGGETNAPIRLGTDYTWGSGRAILDGTPNIGSATNERALNVYVKDVMLSDLEIRNYYNTGVYVNGGNNLVISNCYFHHLGVFPYVYSYGKAVYALDSQNLVIVSNVIHDCNYAGVILSYRTTNVIIHGNQIYDLQADGINGWAYGYTLLSGNTIHSLTNGVNHGDGWQILGAPVAAPIICCNNYLYDSTQDAFFEPYFAPVGSGEFGEYYLFNNIIDNPNPGTNGLAGWYNGVCLDYYGSGDSVYIFNNTLCNLNSGSGAFGYGFSRSAALLVTNLFYLNNLVWHSAVGSGLVITNYLNKWTDYNAYTNYWREDACLPAGGSALGTLDNFQALYPDQEQHSIYTPIEFADYAGKDFTPANGTVLNTGTNLAALLASASNSFRVIPERYRPDLLRDYYGRLRGAAWDVGAIEVAYYPKAQVQFSPASRSRMYFPGTVTITCTNLEAVIYWSTNGTPTELSSHGPSPLTVTLGEPVVLEAFAMAPNAEPGDMGACRLERIYATQIHGEPVFSGPLNIR